MILVIKTLTIISLFILLIIEHLKIKQAYQNEHKFIMENEKT